VYADAAVAPAVAWQRTKYAPIHMHAAFNRLRPNLPQQQSISHRSFFFSFLFLHETRQDDTQEGRNLKYAAWKCIYGLRNPATEQMVARNIKRTKKTRSDTILRQRLQQLPGRRCQHNNGCIIRESFCWTPAPHQQPDLSDMRQGSRIHCGLTKDHTNADAHTHTHT